MFDRLSAKKRIVAVGAFAAVLLWGLAASAETVQVNAHCNLFGAGHATLPEPGGGGAGVAPAVFSFTPGPDQVLTFGSITGQAAANHDVSFVGPEGGYGGYSDIESYGGIAGIKCPNGLFFAGLFLDDAEPANPAPPRLNFAEGQSINFWTLSPALGQIFFVGDGLRETGSGDRQQFCAPPTATRLFLGIADAFNFVGEPGWYDDNLGSYTATFAIAVVPEPSWLVSLVGGVIGLAVARLRGRSRRLAGSPAVSRASTAGWLTSSQRPMESVRHI